MSKVLMKTPPIRGKIMMVNTQVTCPSIAEESMEVGPSANHMRVKYRKVLMGDEMCPRHNSAHCKKHPNSQAISFHILHVLQSFSEKKSP